MAELDPPDRPCSCCSRQLQEHEPATCRTCVGAARADLHGIVNAYALLPATLEVGALGSNAPRLDGAHSDESPLPGGNILVLLAGGSDARSNQGDDRDSDPPSVSHILATHEDSWRNFFGHPAANGPAYVTTATNYLLAHVQAAANKHPAFADFAGEMRQLRWCLEHAAGVNERPLRAEAPCIGTEGQECGGQLERHWHDCSHAAGHRHQDGDRCGLEDEWTCRSCKRRYTHAAYWLAVKDWLDWEAKRKQREQEESA